MRAVPARTARKGVGKVNWRRWALRASAWLLAAIVAFHAVCAVALAGLRWVNPWTTAVQMQRRCESFFHKGRYQKQYVFVPLTSISRDLQHAVIAAEDGRFYEHHGIDWKQLRIVVDEGIESGEVPRGASTITQQLIKNLFLTTSRTVIRKAFEFSLVPLTERILGKDRILELYLNVIEWGPGVWGAEAAAHHHYHTTAARLSREQSARLAALLPAPRTRKPARMNQYSEAILDRMRKMGW
jgi:monofunctional glycosyltransferase